MSFKRIAENSLVGMEREAGTVMVPICAHGYLILVLAGESAVALSDRDVLCGSELLRVGEEEEIS